MADDRVKSDWNHTSAILAQNHNCHCGKNSATKKPADYHPCPPAKPKPRPSERMKPTQLRTLLEE